MAFVAALSSAAIGACKQDRPADQPYNQPTNPETQPTTTPTTTGGMDTGMDTGIDTDADTGVDTDADTGVDTGMDTGTDTMDTGTDTMDTGVDTLDEAEAYLDTDLFIKGPARLGPACPMLVEGVTVTTLDTPHGIALEFTKARGDGEGALQDHVEQMAQMYEIHAGHGAMLWQHMGHMRAEGTHLAELGQPGHLTMGNPMPATDAQSESTDVGARVVLTPHDPAQLDNLRIQIRDHQRRMASGECWIPGGM